LTYFLNLLVGNLKTRVEDVALSYEVKDLIVILIIHGKTLFRIKLLNLAVFNYFVIA
jgi:hypothetical protein